MTATIELEDPLVCVRANLLKVITSAVFLLFFQIYMVAPLIPSLAVQFRVSRETVGYLIPAYTIPYAVAALVIGVMSDQFGRRAVLFFSLATFPLFSFIQAAAPSVNSLTILRMMAGVCNGGIAVVGLSLAGDLFPPEDRGRAVGWIFGAIAGGGAAGSTLGGVLAPLIGWRGLFVGTAIVGAALLIRAIPLWRQLAMPAPNRVSLPLVLAGYFQLLSTARGARTYGFIFLNAVFHAGVFTWLGVHLHDRYGLGEAGIGLALLGYGVPGFFLGPIVGRIVDRHGRRWFIPAGFLIAAGAAALLIPRTPMLIAVIAAPILSLGFDLSHPLLAGISTTLDARRRGQAMGMNAFAIFFGFGCGSLCFGWLATPDILRAFAVFALVQAVLGGIAFIAFRSE